jgi:acylphosphatase
MHRKTCHFEGRVQGVGFRYTTQNIALQYNVNGYVRNTHDGGVELVMEGPDEEMDHLLESLANRMGGFIRKTEVETSPATGEFQEFGIRH